MNVKYKESCAIYYNINRKHFVHEFIVNQMQAYFKITHSPTFFFFFFGQLEVVGKCYKCFSVNYLLFYTDLYSFCHHLRTAVVMCVSLFYIQKYPIKLKSLYQMKQLYSATFETTSKCTLLKTDPLPQPTSANHDRARTALFECITESFCICVTAEEEQHHLGQKFYRNVGGGGRLTGDVCYNATLPWAVWGGGEQDGVITSPPPLYLLSARGGCFSKEIFFATL